MIIHTLERPDTMPELAHWLEQQLVGDTLGFVVAELRAALPPKPMAPQSLNDLLGTHLTEVLRTGLTALPETQLRKFFRYPDRLLELQELVLIEGVAYWDNVPRPETLVADSARLWQLLQTRLKEPGQDKLVTTSDELVAGTHSRGRGRLNDVLDDRPIAQAVGSGQPEAYPTVKPAKSATGRRTWMVAVAAMFLVGIGIGWFAPHAEAKGMAWTRPETFLPPKDRQEFLTRLAKLARDWFDKRPETIAELKERIIEFRLGCTRLQLHKSVIPIEDRTWLVKDCTTWTEELDNQLVELERGEPVESVRTAVDAIINRLIEKLEKKAKS